MRVRDFLAYAWRRTLHNLPQKLLALLAAGGLWFVATGERRANVDRSFTVPLRVFDDTANSPQSERRSASGLPDDVRVTLGGPRNALLSLSGDEIEASVNLTGVPEGPFQQPIRVRPPSGFQVVRFTPTVASGFLDTEITRTLGVTLATANLPARALPRFEVTPRTVQVTGAQRIVRGVSTVTTVPVSLPPGAVAEVRLLALDASGRPVTDVRLNPATVNVQRTDSGDLPIKTVPVELPDPPANLDVVEAEINPPQVRVLADQATLAKLSGVTARVPYRVGRYSARANLQLPAGARSLDVVTVTLNVRAKNAAPAHP